MPDGRFLSKSIAHDLELNTISFEADYLFSRCVPHLDVEGRMAGHPAQVKAIAVPLRAEMTTEAVERALDELDTAGLVVWYEVDGRPFLAFPGFSRHQRGLRRNREAPSGIPTPKGNAAQRVGGSLRSSSGVAPDEVRPREGKGREVKVSVRDESGEPGESPGPPRKRHTCSEGFEVAWKIHHRGSKKEAFAEWERAVPSRVSQPEVIRTLRKYVAEFDGGFHGKHLFRWIRDDMWENYPPPPPSGYDTDPDVLALLAIQREAMQADREHPE